MNSKQKGSRGERALRDVWKKHGYEDAHRSQQYSGKGESSADIEGIDPRLHIECKTGYSFKQIYNFMSQSASDAKDGQIPICNIKMDRMPWLWVCYLDDGIEMWKEGHHVEVKTICMIAHCKDCINYNPKTEECFRHGWRYPMNPDDFCSRGERREE